MLVNTNTAQKASFNQFSNNATQNKPASNDQAQKPAQDHDKKENTDKK